VLLGKVGHLPTETDRPVDLRAQDVGLTEVSGEVDDDVDE
jgi:hypothetical protein